MTTVRPDRKNPGQYDMILTEEMRAQLEMLQASPSWKVYRKFLIDLKIAHLEQQLGVTDPNLLLKNTGIAAGLNWAVNQLDLSVAQFKNKAQHGVGDTEKPN